ncbi:uncharacterized protein LOC125231324 [Leguminivora glycinivorella]|uniref:uncharacterized protein LOC125231324 n=1 Tax=Leguminivora glycinivorella TaxID=1035111 RepID=UPI00200C5578|nr:uncharacterized protein LOC125231324 [Leguminivora glycinivorella]
MTKDYVSFFCYSQSYLRNQLSPRAKKVHCSRKLFSRGSAIIINLISDIRIAAPSIIRLCHDVKHKPFFCLICNGFDFSCFSPETTQRPTDATQPSTTVASISVSTAVSTDEPMS